jgi:FMN reductase
MTQLVALGGTIKARSSTELALLVAVRAAEAAGARVRVFDGPALTALPHFGSAAMTPEHGADLIAAIRDCDGLLIATPGYHGTVSGVVKNALDYIEALAKDARVYLDGRAVGLIATAYGAQAAVTTLMTLRTITHALRGWPTPLGASVIASPGLFDADGQCTDEKVRGVLEAVGRQTADGARWLKGAGAGEGLRA